MFPYEIVPRERILESLDRADALLRWAFDDDDEIDDDDFDDDEINERLRDSAVRFALETYRHCAVAVESAEDLTLVRVLHRAIAVLLDHEDDHHETGHLSVVLSALTRLLRLGLPADKAIASLARHEDEQVRLSIASGLRPTGKQERALLVELLSDPVAPVRKAARMSLAEHGDAPWWAGKWSSCPASRLLPDEVEKAGPALREVSELLDAPVWELYGTKTTALGKLQRALRNLPPALALETLEMTAKPAQAYVVTKLVPILGESVQWPGGLDTYMALLRHWGDSAEGLSTCNSLVAIALSCPSDVRLELFRRCVALSKSDPLDESRSRYHTASWLAASVAGHIWPAEGPVTELLETILDAGRNDEPGDPSRQTELVSALFMAGVDCTEIYPRLFAARLEGYPAEWRGIGYRIDELLARAPTTRVRTFAEECLRAESEVTVAWGLEQLLGPAYDRKLDGSPKARVATFLASPVLRRRILASWDLTAKALPELRTMLTADELSYLEAGMVMESIARFFGGVAESIDIEDDFVPRALAWRQRVQKSAGVFLGPPSKRIPPTEAEWAAFERSRLADESGEIDERIRVFAHTLRPGPWTSRERVDLTAYMEHFRNDDCGASVGLHLAHALCAKPTLEHLALIDEVFSNCDPRARPLMKMAPARFRKAIGIAPSPPETPATSALPEEAWPGDD